MATESDANVPAGILCEDYLVDDDSGACWRCGGDPLDHIDDKCHGWQRGPNGLCLDCGRAFVRHPADVARYLRAVAAHRHDLSTRAIERRDT